MYATFVFVKKAKFGRLWLINIGSERVDHPAGANTSCRRESGVGTELSWHHTSESVSIKQQKFYLLVCFKCDCLFRARPRRRADLLHVWRGSVGAHAGGPGYAGEAGGDVGPVRKPAVPHGRSANRGNQGWFWRFGLNRTPAGHLSMTRRTPLDSCVCLTDGMEVDATAMEAGQFEDADVEH